MTIMPLAHVSSHQSPLSCEGRVNGTNLDVGVDDRGIRVRSLDGLRDTSGGVASTTNGTRASGSWGVGAVEPVHGYGSVIPDGQDKHHLLQLLAHLGQTTLGRKVVGVVEGNLLRLAKVLGDAVTTDACNLGHAVGDSLAALDVEALDLGQGAGGGAIVGDELGHDGEGFGGIDGQARAVEGVVAHAVRVEVTAALVTVAIAAGVTITARGSVGAAGLAVDCARVRSHGGSNRVGLPNDDMLAVNKVVVLVYNGLGYAPDVHLGAARSVSTSSSVGAGSVPALNIGLAIDELDVVGALRVTVTSTVLGTSLVVGELGHATIGIHLTEVDSAI